MAKVEMDGSPCPHGDCKDKKQVFETGHSLAVHWGMMHDKPFPDDLDNSQSDRHRKAISEARTGYQMSEEHKKNMIEAVTGKELSEQHKEKISQSMQEYEKTEEHRKNLSEALKGKPVRPGAGVVDWYDIPVEDDDRKVQGGLELSIINLLLKICRPDEIQIHPQDKFNYTVDFLVGSIVIEAKGWVQERSIQKAEEFLNQYGDEYKYIVIGQHPDTEQIPCHKWFYESEGEEVLSYIGEHNGKS